ncbi:MAG TPA: CvpA family protein [Terriglobales bacterium]|jgi:membrane protein required for colicin V production|nr:CvpA family protein [Terriglobales bacterium]
MNGLDWIIAGIIVLSVLLAAQQGFFYELFSLAGVVIGYIAAAWGYGRVAVWYAPLVKSAWVADVAGFLTIFVAIVLLAGIIGRLARWFFKEAGLRWFDRLLGAAFGLIRGVLFVAVFLLAFTSFAPGSQMMARSTIAPYALIVARAAIWAAPGQVRARFDEGLKAVRDMRISTPQNQNRDTEPAQNKSAPAKPERAAK